MPFSKAMATRMVIEVIEMIVLLGINILLSQYGPDLIRATFNPSMDSSIDLGATSIPDVSRLKVDAYL